MRVGDKDIASEAVSHWKYLAPALTAPQSEGDYNSSFGIHFYSKRSITC